VDSTAQGLHESWVAMQAQMPSRAPDTASCPVLERRVATASGLHIIDDDGEELVACSRRTRRQPASSNTVGSLPRHGTQ